MAQAFKLARIEGRSYAPATGEDLGAALARAASLAEGDARAASKDPDWWGYPVAQMFYLAAEAYEQGARASIGHGRAGRYEQAADEYRRRAQVIEAEAQASRDGARAERMQAAFNAGYHDECAGDAPQRNYSFDAREAYLLGRHYAKHGTPCPEDVNSFRDKGGDWIRAGGCKYRVRYPTGKTTEATIELEGPAE